jgi:ABC-type nickel/cobalt efflux system permease component RcnA
MMFTCISKVVAHPLGNFSISQYSALKIGKHEIEVRYIVDMAEIPAFQEIQESGLIAKVEDVSVEPYVARQAEILRAGLSLLVNGQRVALRTMSYEIIFPEGAGGLPTLKTAVTYEGKLFADAGGVTSLNYRDHNFAGRAGWKEIIAVGAPGVRLVSSSVPERDRSAGLTDYPTDLLNSPPQQLEAKINFSVTPPTVSATASVAAEPLAAKNTAAVPQTKQLEENRSRPNTTTGAKSSPVENSPQLKPNSQATPRSSFTEIIAKKELSVGIVFAALAIAIGLGAFHALEPGHGKTLVAAYLVGSRGTVKHAMLLGLIVTAAHTAGVYLLGAITLYASRYIVPERLYPWLSALSGVVIALLGLFLLVRRYQGKAAWWDHSHEHNHDSRGEHHHHDHDHTHGHHNHHHHHHHGVHQAVSLKQLLALGVSGGIVPCPAALVVLLSAVAMERIGFGLLLIVAFSVGLAAVLIAIGILMVYARQFMSRFQGEGTWMTHWLPMTSSAFIFLAGVGLTWEALRNGALLRFGL